MTYALEKDRCEEVEFLTYTCISYNRPVEVVGKVFDKYIPDKYKCKPDSEKTKQKEKQPLNVDTVIRVMLIFGKRNTIRLCIRRPRNTFEQTKEVFNKKDCSKC